MIRVSGSRNKPGFSTGDSIPDFFWIFWNRITKKVHIGNIRTSYCLFRLFSNPGPCSEPGGQSHSGLEAEGRLKGGFPGVRTVLSIRHSNKAALWLWIRSLEFISIVWQWASVTIPFIRWEGGVQAGFLAVGQAASGARRTGSRATNKKSSNLGIL